MQSESQRSEAKLPVFKQRHFHFKDENGKDSHLNSYASSSRLRHSHRLPRYLSPDESANLVSSEECSPLSTLNRENSVVVQGNKRMELINRAETNKLKILISKGWDCESYLKVLDSMQQNRESLKSVIDLNNVRLSNETRFEATPARRSTKHLTTLKRN